MKVGTENIVNLVPTFWFRWSVHNGTDAVGKEVGLEPQCNWRGGGPKPRTPPPLRTLQTDARGGGGVFVGNYRTLPPFMCGGNANMLQKLMFFFTNSKAPALCCQDVQKSIVNSIMTKQKISTLLFRRIEQFHPHLSVARMSRTEVEICPKKRFIFQKFTKFAPIYVSSKRLELNTGF